MKPLEFLLGHFRGEGRYAMVEYAFQKEVIGSFEAGGRFIALRMDASYPLADGRKDVHKAFVIVGSEPPAKSAPTPTPTAARCASMPSNAMTIILNLPTWPPAMPANEARAQNSSTHGGRF